MFVCFDSGGFGPIPNLPVCLLESGVRKPSPDCNVCLFGLTGSEYTGGVICNVCLFVLTGLEYPGGVISGLFQLLMSRECRMQGEYLLRSCLGE